MAKFEHHLFVCENVRPDGHHRGCCASKGGPTVRALMKKLIHDRGLKGVVRANAAGCLDQCERGVSVVVYPQETWYGGVTLDDVPEILDALDRGTVVERLVIPDDALTGQTRTE